MRIDQEFQIRSDDWSWQLLGHAETDLFVRIVSDRYDFSSMVFSDFRIHMAHGELIHRALDVVRSHFHGPAAGMQIKFLDIMPVAPGEVLDKEVLVARHDQIVDALRKHGAAHDYCVSNSILNYRAGKYETTVTTA